MSRWFRHYAGMMRDDKLVSAAIKAKQPVERVVWVWGAILESAAEIDDGGRFNLDTAEVAYFLRADEADICLVVDALAGLGRISDDRVVKWSDRQFTSDRSADRQAKYRERKRSKVVGSDKDQSRDGEVTSLSRHGDAPEAETETYTEAEQKPRTWPSDRLIEAASINGGCHPNLPVSIAQILAYLDKGYDLERDVLPVIRAKASPEIRKWSYFGTIIEANARERAAIPQKAVPPAEDWAKRLEVWHGSGTWVGVWGPKPGEPGCRVPPELLTRAA